MKFNEFIFEDSDLRELLTHYDQVKHKGQLLVLDRWPDGHLTISIGNRMIRSGTFDKIKPIWDQLKNNAVSEGESGHDIIKRKLQDIESRKTSPEEEEEEYQKHIERMKAAQREYLKKNPNSIYKQPTD